MFFQSAEPETSVSSHPLHETRRKGKRDRVSCGLLLLQNRDWATTRSSWKDEEACVSSGTRWSVFRIGCKMS